MLSQTCFCTLLALLMCFGATKGGPENQSWHKNSMTYPTVYVDTFGHGNFLSIQAAIDSVPSNNKNWIRIYVKAGQYREQITIPREKPFIYIDGEGTWKTTVSWAASDSIATDATFTSEADNIVVRCITFINYYNHPPEKNTNPIKPAVAALISGDKSAFYKVAFIGFQDTLWDLQGRHYFKLCTIQGAVDFIMGAGQSIYEECTISVVTGTLQSPGYITAQRRSNPAETNGFVFTNCDVVGNGKTFLGRPWAGYARVLFYNCSMPDIIVPEGWDPWDYIGHENQLTFAEYGCQGSGSDTSKRVSWEQKLSNEMVNQLISISFIDQEGWISSQPFNMLE